MADMSETFGHKDTFVPFSNGHEYRMWLEINCQSGERGCRKYNPNASSSRHGCAIECAVALGNATDGNMPCRLGLRGGLLVEAANGRLQAVDPGVIPRCPEYKGYDEPDDRPRRSPKPPEGQIDLLDPRNAPEPARTPA